MSPIERSSGGGSSAAQAIRNAFTNGTTAGDYTTASAVFVDVPLTTTIAGAVGDVLQVEFSCVATNNAAVATSNFIALVATTSSTVIRQQGFPCAATASSFTNLVFLYLYTVAAGDIAAGNVAVKVQFATGGTGTLALSNTALKSAPQIALVNLLH